eukprot:Nk52_evm39s2657 gene=Nk52_evmTU39s2657
MEISFKGHRALITGAGKGLGRSIAIALLKGGAEVVAVSRTETDLMSLRKEHSSIETFQCDLANFDQVRDVMGKVGNISLLVNNAGISLRDPFLDAKIEDIAKTMDVHVTATALISQILAKRMIENNIEGSIVNVSSMISKFSALDHLSYCSSKGALDQMTRVMAHELGPKKIRVNAVNPTVIFTPMGREAWADPAKSRALTDRTPLGRFAEEHEVVDPIMFLLSSKASMITGVMLPIDGGITIHID